MHSSPADNAESGNLAGNLIDDVLARLSAEGYAITAQRRAILGLVFEREHCFSAEDLLTRVQESGLGIGRATVFRTLDILTRLGYVGRVTDGERSAYTVCGAGHHHHLVCSRCGQVVRVDGCPIDDLLRDLESKTGFRIRDHRVEMAGLCPTCQK